jgi:hypothetical protein
MPFRWHSQRKGAAADSAPDHILRFTICHEKTEQGERPVEIAFPVFFLTDL